MPRSDQFSSDSNYREGESFEPVQEIRRLRHELASRIESLRHRVDFSQFENHKEFTSRLLFEESVDNPRQENTKSFDLNADINISRFQERLDETSQMLSQLQETVASTTSFQEKKTNIVDLNHLPAVEEIQKKTKRSVETIVEIQRVSAAVPNETDAETTEFRTEEQSQNRLAPTLLEKMNVGLVFLGFFAVFLAILYFIRGDGNDIQLGTPTILVGLSLIIVGVAGRLGQDYANRREIREIQRGKLTTAV